MLDAGTDAEAHADADAGDRRAEEKTEEKASPAEAGHHDNKIRGLDA